MTENGKYSLSNFKSSKCRTFSHDIRKTYSQGNFGLYIFLIILVTPGPGSYRIPSDFGYYESKNR